MPDDIATLAAGCRFRDCGHRTEPRCAVRQAVTDGRLAESRLRHYHRLESERAALHRRQDALAMLVEKQRTKAVHKAMRQMPDKG